MFNFFLLVFIPLLVEGKTILFLGDSLTEGYQLQKEEAFPALIEKELRKKDPSVKVINGGVAGATSASGLKRLDWYLKSRPDIMVLALGANDGLRGIKVEETEKNLSAAVKEAQKRNIKVILAGMMIPTNMGEDYRTKFKNVFPKVASTYKLPLIPFLLEGVAGVPKLNLPDGLHPNPAGYEIVAKTVLKYLEKEL